MRNALGERNRLGRGKPGPKHSKETREKLRRIAIESGRFCGDRSPNWKGGITPKNLMLRQSSAYREWRMAVYERDKYTCRGCGDTRGGNLEPHHIKSWSDYLEFRFEVSNGLTLCERCHKKTHRRSQ
jgi:hypothetical protein